MSFVRWEIERDVAVVVIDRPEKKNALNKELREELYNTVKNVVSIKDIKAIIITGVEDVFVAGADIMTMKDYTEEDAKEASLHGSKIFSYIEDTGLPVSAAVNGWALGGGLELALACDIRISSEDARFGQPEVRLGIMPGYGATFRLPKIIGMGRAKELIITGRIIDAHEAERIGLVSEVVKKEELMKRAKDIARGLSGATVAIGFVKDAINKAFDMKKEDAIKYISNLYGKLYNTCDTKEGIRAYLEKRKPCFKGE